MASQTSAPAAPPSDGEDDTSRLHIHSIKEMPSGHDAELATIFREMRRAADVPRERMAGRLATTIEIIDALESGAIFALPPWPELSRIVTAYAVMLGLDARPLLRRLEAQLGPDAGMVAASPPKTAAPAPPPASPPAPPAPPTAKPGGPPMPPSVAAAAPKPDAAPPIPEMAAPAQPPGSQAQPQPREERAASVAGEKQALKKSPSGFLKPVLNWLVLAGFVAALGSGVWYAAQHPRMVWSALDTLPDPIPRAMRSAWKFMRPLEGTTTRRQVSDPDNRKSDKLP